MIQKEWFSKISTDHLLSLRQSKFCKYPRFEFDKDIIAGTVWLGYTLDKEALLAELAKRPNRIRAKDRRKVKK
jgi:hypothetical protein